MKKIELEGNVGDELELSYNGDSLRVKLDVHGIVPDVTNAVINAMKKDANAFLVAAQLIFRGNLSGETHARKAIEKVVKATFDDVAPAPGRKTAEVKPEKKATSETTVEKAKPEEKKSPETEEKVADPEPQKKGDDAASKADVEKKAEEPDVKSAKTATTAKKTTNKKKSS